MKVQCVDTLVNKIIVKRKKNEKEIGRRKRVGFEWWLPALANTRDEDHSNGRFPSHHSEEVK